MHGACSPFAQHQSIARRRRTGFWIHGRNSVVYPVRPHWQRLFFYGKKQKRFATLFSGVALMAYTFMVSNTYAIFLMGIGLMAVPYFLDF